MDSVCYCLLNHHVKVCQCSFTACTHQLKKIPVLFLCIRSYFSTPRIGNTDCRTHRKLVLGA